MEPTELMFWSPETSPNCGMKVVLDGAHVFEDIAPRLVDVTGDGVPEVIVVRSHLQHGAQLVIYAQRTDPAQLQILAATPYIGTRFRWLAPVGAADFDGDGHVEVAFVDRPHLARLLRVWRYTGESFHEIARIDGLTNHRIGEDFISGGVRDCGEGPEIIVMDADWTWIMAARLTQDQIVASRITPFEGPESVAAALDCR